MAVLVGADPERESSVIRNPVITPKLLVVSDDRDTAGLVCELCARHGNCVVVDSQAAAMGQLETAQLIAGLIVERELREGSALQVAAHARQQHNIPTLLISAQNTHRSVHEAYQIGARYLCKPVEPVELEMFISAAVAQARSGAEAKLRALAELTERAGLTRREAEVVELALHNVARANMADAMGITESTLKFHIRSLLDKCDARNLSELVRSLLLHLGQASA